MKIIHSVREFQEWRNGLSPEASLGLVPTMGALHSGHASLMKESVQLNTHTLVSLFVNPTQFNQASDLAHYPRTWESDVSLCERLGVSVLFAPTESSELYPDHYTYQVRETALSSELCGRSRPGHFEGVLTVVLKLLNLAQAHRAYFGEKDFQQLTLIQGMVKAFFLKTEIIACPTIREHSGLALSSRNLRLSAEELEIAPRLHQAMTHETSIEAARKNLESHGFKVDYLEDIEWNGCKRRFAAAWLGKVRLIDNVSLT